MKLLLPMLACSVLFCQEMLSQKVQPEVLSSGGDHFAHATLSLDWTLGELAVETIGNDPQLTQGFHQGNLHISTSVIAPGIKGSMVVYPNPTGAQVYIESHDLDYSNLRLIDINGTILLSVRAPETTIDLSRYPPGVYVLQLWKNDRLLATTKIQKF